MISWEDVVRSVFCERQDHKCSTAGKEWASLTLGGLAPSSFLGMALLQGVGVSVICTKLHSWVYTWWPVDSARFSLKAVWLVFPPVHAQTLS